MKKSYDWDITVCIFLPNSTRKVKVFCSVHTAVHALKLRILKELGYPIFDTQIDLLYKGKKIDRGYSLQQHGIISSAELQLRFERVPPRTNHQPQTRVGLVLRASCTHHNCLKFNQDVDICLGFGQFSVSQIACQTRCHLCPSRDYFSSFMLCKRISVNKCSYLLKGTSKRVGRGQTARAINKQIIANEETTLTDLITRYASKYEGLVLCVNHV